MSTRLPTRRLFGATLLAGAAFSSACSLFPAERIVYSQHGARIGIEADPTVTRSSRPVLNNHPVELSATDIASLLQFIRVSGWSGTIVGMVAPPRPIPLFTPSELSTIADYLAVAFHDSKPTERIIFSLPKPDVAYSEDRTTGALFLRGRYLHVVVTDHSAFLKADTAGDDLRDPRDTKGMKLWIAPPAQAAAVPDTEEPQWAPFEAVHISLNVKEALAQVPKAPPVRTAQPDAGPAVLPSLPPKAIQTGPAPNDLQLQVRELTSSNLELRSRLEEQNKRMEQLTAELEQLRAELEKAKPKKQPPKKTPAP